MHIDEGQFLAGAHYNASGLKGHLADLYFPTHYSFSTTSSNRLPLANMLELITELYEAAYMVGYFLFSNSL